MTGVDISDKQIELAQRNVARAVFVREDMMDLSFSAERFDAVAAFYSIVHVPPRTSRSCCATSAWLRKDGVLVISLEKPARSAAQTTKKIGWERPCTGATSTPKPTCV
ncbi:MAG: class I SAM-dependent methyltransferase [Caldilineaceae bacterium]